jgi:hypothetical protein
LTNFAKKLLPLHRGGFESLFSIFFALIFFTLTLATSFVSASFLPKVSKLSEGERLKDKFWSSEMVKIDRGQHNYCRCRRRHCLHSFVMMKTTV